MTWPDPSDYQDAIQSPSSCFLLPELKGSSVVTNALGLPKVMSGNFASVYEVSFSNRKWAVRCFLRQVLDQHRRYLSICQYLMAARMDCMVGFDYLHQGIRLRGAWYPIVRMEWVDGVPLNEYVGAHASDPKALAGLLEKFVCILTELRRNHIAHGDLQHANILVERRGRIRLVDYDGMYVPVFSGEHSPELGHPNFQHPLRRSIHYGADLDNFSALVIYLSIRALLSDESLWSQYHTGENLLFSAGDFRRPSQSPVFKTLRGSSDAIVRHLVSVLEQASAASIESVPNLLDILDGDSEPEVVKPGVHDPGCIVFLIDQSQSMAACWGAGFRPAAVLVSDIVNRCVDGLVRRAENSTAASGTYDLGLMGYANAPMSAFDGRLKGRFLVSLRGVAQAPLRVESRKRNVSAGGGALASQVVQFPVWLTPRSSGTASLSVGYGGIYPVLERWTTAHQDSPPPIVFHMTMGEWTDQTVTAQARSLLRLKTKRGRIVVFNFVIGKPGSRHVLFPEADTFLSAPLRDVFALSSKLPRSLANGLNGSERSRCLVVNATQEDILFVLEAVLGM